MSYNSDGLVSETVYSVGEINQTSYNFSERSVNTYEDGRLVKKEEFNQLTGLPYLVWIFEYDSTGSLVKIIGKYDGNTDGTQDAAATYVVTYDANGNLHQSVYSEDENLDGKTDYSYTTTFKFQNDEMPTASHGIGMVPYNLKAPLTNLIIWDWAGN